MAGIKEKLEAAGYDTSSLNENDLMQKLSSAGYDTSAIQTQPEQPKATATDALGQMVKNGTGPIGVTQDVMDAVHRSFKELGDFTEKSLSKGGINMASPFVGAEPIPVSPTAAKVMGKVVQYTPDALMAIGPAGEAATAVKESPVLRALVPGAKAAVGREIGAAEAAAGVKSVIPTVSNMAKRLDLPARERGFADIVNSVKTKLDAKEPISAQDLTDFRDLVKQQYGAGKIAKGTRLDALTAQANKGAGNLLNDLVPGRSKLSSDYATMQKVHKGLKLLATAGGVGAGGIGLARVILKKLAGY